MTTNPHLPLGQPQPPPPPQPMRPEYAPAIVSVSAPSRPMMVRPPSLVVAPGNGNNITCNSNDGNNIGSIINSIINARSGNDFLSYQNYPSPTFNSCNSVLMSQSLAALQQMSYHAPAGRQQQQQWQRPIHPMTSSSSTPPSSIGHHDSCNGWGASTVVSNIINTAPPTPTVLSSSSPVAAAAAVAAAGEGLGELAGRGSSGLLEAMTTMKPPPEVVIGIPRHHGGGGGGGLMMRSQNGGGTTTIHLPAVVATLPTTRDSITGSAIIASSTAPLLISTSHHRPAHHHHHAQPPPSQCGHPVPEFLCHLYSMLDDPSLSDIILWEVPSADESNHAGGGKGGIGKIVVLNPTRLQNEVLGKYYRHSQYSSFQRQLNYFGFKKRLHGSRKGKLGPCSYVHDALGSELESLLGIKRRSATSASSSSSSLAGNNGGNGIIVGKRRASSGGLGGVDPGGDGGAGGPSSASRLANNVRSFPGSASHGTVASCPVAPSTSNFVPPPNKTSKRNDSWCLNDGDARSLNQGQGAGGATAGSAPPWSTVPRPPSSSNAQTGNVGLAMRRYDPTVVNARKLLEMNFLKTQQDHYHQQQHQSQQQQQQYQLQQSVNQTPHQQLVAMQLNILSAQNQQMVAMMKSPLRFPPGHPFAAPSATDAEGKAPVGHCITVPPTNAIPTINGTGSNSLKGQSMIANLIFEGNHHTTAAAFSSDRTFIGLFPNSGAPPSVVSGGVCATQDSLLNSMTTPTTMTTTTTTKSSNASIGHLSPPIATSDNGTLLPSPPASNNGTLAAMIGHPAETTHHHSCQDFNDLLSHLLGTTLPPSDELFDDDMSAGNLFDFGDDMAGEGTAAMIGGPLLIADDGMLLPS